MGRGEPMPLRLFRAPWAELPAIVACLQYRASPEICGASIGGCLIFWEAAHDADLPDWDLGCVACIGMQSVALSKETPTCVRPSAPCHRPDVVNVISVLMI